MKISFAITVCDEFDEIQRLVAVLRPHLHADDEIVIQYDVPRAPQAMVDYLESLRARQPRISVVPFALNDDFAAFRNHLKRFCAGDYIFQIDADEYPAEKLLLNIHDILEKNPRVDVLTVARVNTVTGLSRAHIEKWRWRVDAKGWVNFPDPQGRIYRNSDAIYWVNRVHERLAGYRVRAHLPRDPELALIHPKTIGRQEAQNAYYEMLLKSPLSDNKAK